MDDIPVQFFQSVIAVELAVTGALLWNIRYFDRTADDGPRTTNPWLLLAVSLVLATTVFGSLYAIRHRGQETAASAVTVGLAVSIVPILLRVLPPLWSRDGEAPQARVTVIGLTLYFVVIACVVVALNS